MLEQKESKDYTMNLCEGSILKKLLLFSIPLMASSMLQLLFNAADVVVVGQFAGKNSLAAVGSNGSIINLLTNVFMGLSIGANVLVARYFAARKEEKLRRTVHTAITISIVCGIVMAIIGIVMARQLLTWMQSPKGVIDLATIYLRIYFLGMPAVMLYNFGAAILRGVGDTKRPLYYLGFSGVVNVVLNLIFVIIIKMDVAGVALATVISQYISAALVLRCLAKEESAIRVEKQYLGIDKNILIRGKQAMEATQSVVVTAGKVVSGKILVDMADNIKNTVVGFVPGSAVIGDVADAIKFKKKQTEMANSRVDLKNTLKRATPTNNVDSDIQTQTQRVNNVTKSNTYKAKK